MHLHLLHLHLNRKNFCYFPFRQTLIAWITCINPFFRWVICQFCCSTTQGILLQLMLPCVQFCPTDLRIEISHCGCFYVFLSQYFHFDWSWGELGWEVVQEVRQVAGFSMDNPHDVVSCLENMISSKLKLISITELATSMHQFDQYLYHTWDESSLKAKVTNSWANLCLWPTEREESWDV